MPQVNRWQRGGLAWRREPRLSRMLGVSLGIHLCGLIVAAGFLSVQQPLVRKPVYMVDLVTLPVANPQAGRPDAAPGKVKPVQKPKPATKPIAKPKPVVKPEPKPKPKPKPQPKPQPVVKSVPKPAPQPVPKKSYDDVLQEIAKKRRAQERSDLEAKLQALMGQDTRATKSEAPLGEVTGQGTEAGVGFGLWLQSYYTDHWKLSKYQIPNLDLEARVEVEFGPRGFLKNFRIIETSGNLNFDNSLKATILSLEKLPREPQKRFVETIYFNLKDMQER